MWTQKKKKKRKKTHGPVYRVAAQLKKFKKPKDSDCFKLPKAETLLRKLWLLAKGLEGKKRQTGFTLSFLFTKSCVEQI